MSIAVAARQSFSILQRRSHAVAATALRQSARRVNAVPSAVAAALPHGLRSLHSAAARAQASDSDSNTIAADATHTQVISRDNRFAKLTDADIEHFRSIVGSEGIVQDDAELQQYNTDWMRKFHGHSKLVLRPKNSEEVAGILKHCNERMLAVVPQGGNTGLVGGSVPVFDEVVLSLNRMNKVLSFDEYSGIVVCESGVILETLNGYLEERGFIMPLDLGAKGSCHVGGNVSTNAGGLRYVRYGSLHGNVLGMEMVLANGTIVDNLSTLRKDNTGYDLKQLFIGAEGTLGVVTKVAILAPRKPASQLVAFLACDSYKSVLAAMQLARSELLEIVSAIEFLDRGSLALVLKHLPGARDPLEGEHPFYMLLETSGSNSEHDNAKLSAFLEKAMEQGLVLDGTVASDTTTIRAIWQLREGVAEALAKDGKGVYKYDISLPVAGMYELVLQIKERLAGAMSQGKVNGVVGYGHLGDGNLHLNVHADKLDSQVLGLIEPYIFERTADVRGSVSAEHGLGLSKVAYIGMSKSAEMVDLMQQVRTLFDPKRILNPYKVLPDAAKTMEKPPAAAGNRNA